MFLLWEFSKNPKFVQLCFGDSLVGQASRETPVTSLLKISHDSLASESPSREKYLENFSKFLGILYFHDLVWQLILKWKLQSRAYIEGFATPFATCSQMDFPIVKNT